MLLDKMSGVDIITASSDVRDIKSNEQLEKEVSTLKRRLRDANSIIDDMGRQMELQKTRTRQLIAGWKIRLQEGDEKVLKCAREKDTQFTELVSELMFIEGCLKKERKEIVEKLNKRDSKIQQLEMTVKKQQRQIDALNKANEKLLESLHDVTLETPDSSPSPSPIPEPLQLGLERLEEETADEVDACNKQVPPSEKQVPRSEVQGLRQRASTVDLIPSRRDRRKGVPNGSILTQNNNHKQQDSNHHHQQHRVRFQDEILVQDDKRRQEFITADPLDFRIRKISLPTYRLPTDEEESIRFL